MSPFEDPRVLTPREQEVVALVARGYSAKEIARATMLTPRMVERYLEVSRHKLGAANTTHLVAKAMSEGLLELH